jgi:hypothetical protein
VAGQVVAAQFLVQLGQQALADRGGVRRLTEADPQVHPRGTGTVGDIDDLDLAVHEGAVVRGHH